MQAQINSFYCFLENENLTRTSDNLESLEGVLVAMSGCPLTSGRDGLNGTTHFIVASNQVS
jgi:hypothetical protein